MRDLPNVYTEPVDSSLSPEFVDAIDRSATTIRRATQLVTAVALYSAIRTFAGPSLFRILLTLACFALAFGLYRLHSSFRNAAERAQPDGLQAAMATNLTALRIAAAAFGLVALLSLSGVITTAAPALYSAGALESSEQEVVNQMSAIADAVDGYVTRHGKLPAAKDYPSLREELIKDGAGELPRRDPWNNGYEYSSGDEGYSLSSFGSDGTRGFEEKRGVDVVLRSGVFVHTPEGVRVPESRR